VSTPLYAPPPESDEPQDTTERKVEDWRLHEALELEIPLPLATLIARTRRVDLHDLRCLVRVKGCPPALAARILL